MSVPLSSADAGEQNSGEKYSQPPTQRHGEMSNLTSEAYENQAISSKPRFHLTAPKGWMNDPCGLGYDPETGLYHLFFQWNPHGNDWGNMSWGHATSTDLMSWGTSSIPALTPSAEYDRHGVFTGCLRPTGIHGDPGALTVIYTSVSHLPIHYTLPYTIGSETLSLAVSQDGGQAWHRQDCNPMLSGPPEQLSVTGWRDPCITTWARQQRSSPTSASPQLYGFISGGILDGTPTVFVYSVNPKDLRQWKYSGLLVDVGLNFCPSRWSGDYGVNWEVANFMTLTNDSGESRDFIIMGAQGCLRPKCSDKTPTDARQKRDPRGQLWMAVTSHGEDFASNDILSKHAFGGVFDHGCLYAANSFWDPQSSQWIVYGWVTEEDLPDSHRHRQGWSGMVSLPRVVRLMTLRRVKKARSSLLASITSIEIVPDSVGKGLFTVYTLGIDSESRITRLRHGAQRSTIAEQLLSVPLTPGPECYFPLRTAHWELKAEVSVGDQCRQVGIEIAHSADFKHLTTIIWEPQLETFTIHRPLTKDLELNHGYESAPHTLFTFLNHQDEEIEENLYVHAFFDKSVLEVFVNGRTVITTRIYHPSERCFGIQFFAEMTEGAYERPTTLVRAECWDGLGTDRG